VRDGKGRFLSGPDRDRHQFTADERSRGGRTTFRRAMDDEPWLLRWLQRKIDASRQRAG
jgi:hypothetical protein